MLNTKSLGEVFSQIRQMGFTIPEVDEDARDKLNLQGNEEAWPWFIRLFAGVSAWIAALFLISFLFAFDMLQSDAGDSLYGPILMRGSCGP